jgi:hypothetical protein
LTASKRACKKYHVWLSNLRHRIKSITSKKFLDIDEVGRIESELKKLEILDETGKIELEQFLSSKGNIDMQSNLVHFVRYCIVSTKCRQLQCTSVDLKDLELPKLTGKAYKLIKCKYKV